MSDTVSDELAIRNLVARYSDGVNRRDGALWSDTWAAEGEWLLMGNPTRGREAILALWEKLMQGFPFVMQLVHSGTVEIQGDRGTGCWYLTEISRAPDGKAGSSVGVYHDQYVREGEVWRFAKRKFDLLYMGPPDLSGQLIPYPSDA